MNNRTYLKVTGAIFAVIAVLHLLRVINGWEAVIGGWFVPIWFSWAAIIIAGYLAYSAFTLKS